MGNPHSLIKLDDSGSLKDTASSPSQAFGFAPVAMACLVSQVKEYPPSQRNRYSHPNTSGYSTYSRPERHTVVLLDIMLESGWWCYPTSHSNTKSLSNQLEVSIEGV